MKNLTKTWLGAALAGCLSLNAAQAADVFTSDTDNGGKSVELKQSGELEEHASKLEQKEEKTTDLFYGGWGGCNTGCYNPCWPTNYYPGNWGCNTGCNTGCYRAYPSYYGNSYYGNSYYNPGYYGNWGWNNGCNSCNYGGYGNYGGYYRPISYERTGQETSPIMPANNLTSSGYPTEPWQQVPQRQQDNFLAPNAPLNNYQANFPAPNQPLNDYRANYPANPQPNDYQGPFPGAMNPNYPANPNYPGAMNPNYPANPNYPMNVPTGNLPANNYGAQPVNNVGNVPVTNVPGAYPAMVVPIGPANPGPRPFQP